MNRETRTVLVFAAVFLVLAGLATYFVMNKQDEVNQKQAEISSMQQEIEALQREADKHDELVAELELLKANFSQYVKILPSPEVATEEKLITLVQEKCERAQFQLNDIRIASDKKAAAKGGRRSASGGFKELEVTLNAEATFEQFLRFLNSLERHETFLRVNSFSCAAAQTAAVDEEGNETWPLRIAMNVSTFRYEAGK